MQDGTNLDNEWSRRRKCEIYFRMSNKPDRPSRPKRKTTNKPILILPFSN